MGRAILEVRGGPYVGRNVVCRAGRRVIVGRMEWADYMFPGDQLMSETHFELILASRTWSVRDLGSSTGTFINGEQITESVLHDGDQIRAGQTTFVVRLDVETASSAANVSHAVPSMLPPTDVMTASPKTKWSFRSFPCRSTQSLAVGQQSSFDPAEIARRLAALVPLYVIIRANDQAGLPESVPQEPLKAESSTGEQSGSSLVLLGPTDGDELAVLVSEVWGQNRLVCLCDRRDRDELAQHLREFARAKWRIETRKLACFQPSALVDFLANGDPEDVNSLTAGMDAVFCEVHQGDRWAVFGTRGFESSLARIGFTRI